MIKRKKKVPLNYYRGLSIRLQEISEIWQLVSWLGSKE